jgi:hypothetical protein
LQGWDFDEENEPESFLDGLKQIRLREDQMITNDLMKLPGYEILKTSAHNSVVFGNSQSKLTVVVANRLPLEEQLGVDLIYFNETFHCFLMIQYKTMEKEREEAVFRFPNKQLTLEIERMKEILNLLKECPANNTADGYRLTENPFFLKMCPRIVFEPDNIGLVKGMYLPLEYWELIIQHPTLVGPKGGNRLGYSNVRRYFDNTEFITIASNGWIGTNINQSSMLEAAIKSTLENGRTAILAIKQVLNKKQPKENENII